MEPPQFWTGYAQDVQKLQRFALRHPCRSPTGPAWVESARDTPFGILLLTVDAGPGEEPRWHASASFATGMYSRMPVARWSPEQYARALRLCQAALQGVGGTAREDGLTREVALHVMRPLTAKERRAAHL